MRNPHISDGFASLWQKLIVEACKTKVIERRFTFHDLRAYYVTQNKDQRGELPAMHASPTTTAKVYERSGVAERKGTDAAISQGGKFGGQKARKQNGDKNISPCRRCDFWWALKDSNLRPTD